MISLDDSERVNLCGVQKEGFCQWWRRTEGADKYFDESHLPNTYRGTCCFGNAP